MNSLLQIPYTRNEKQWYFLSVFYAREMWTELISCIMNFYQERQNRFCNCLISFSGEKGEHIRIIFASFINDNNNYTDEIQSCFQLFLDQNPSTNKISFPYGKAIWGNYRNNSITWNKFKLTDYSQQYIGFHQQTIEVALKLLADDFSEDSFFSLGIYLLTKALGCIDSQEQKNALSLSFQEASAASPHFVYAAKELIKEIDINEVIETIGFYRNENASDYSPELISWLNEAKIILKLYNFQTLCMFICKIIGLIGLRQLMILELMNICYTGTNRRTDI